MSDAHRPLYKKRRPLYHDTEAEALTHGRSPHVHLIEHDNELIRLETVNSTSNAQSDICTEPTTKIRRPKRGLFDTVSPRQESCPMDFCNMAIEPPVEHTRMVNPRVSIKGCVSPKGLNRVGSYAHACAKSDPLISRGQDAAKRRHEDTSNPPTLTTPTCRRLQTRTAYALKRRPSTSNSLTEFTQVPRSHRPLRLLARSASIQASYTSDTSTETMSLSSSTALGSSPDKWNLATSDSNNTSGTEHLPGHERELRDADCLVNEMNELALAHLSGRKGQAGTRKSAAKHLFPLRDTETTSGTRLSPRSLQARRKQPRCGEASYCQRPLSPTSPSPAYSRPVSYSPSGVSRRQDKRRRLIITDS